MDQKKHLNLINPLHLVTIAYNSCMYLGEDIYSEQVYAYLKKT